MSLAANKVVVITGASSGIGEAIAKLLASKGAKVVLGARRTDRLEKVKEEITAAGGEAHFVKTDVTKRDEVKALVAEATSTFGPVDCMINNAGVMPLSMMKNVREDEWELMVDVNIKGVLNGIGAVLSGFRERNAGDIINISSDAGRKVFPGGAVYCGTKWAVEAITQGLRLETGGTNIRITSIQPGATTSELGNAIKDEEVLSNFSPMRFLDAEDIARAVLYVIEQPPHCSVNEMLIRSVEQRQ